MQKITLDDSLIIESVPQAQVAEQSDGQTPVDSVNSIGENRDAVSDADSAQMPQQSSQAQVFTAVKSPMKKPMLMPIILLVVVALIAGTATGYGGFRLKSKNGGSLISGSSNPTPIQQVASGAVKAGDVFGMQDASTFKDSAEGYLEDGGIGGEGSHKLLREGGVNQTVVLTSSVTDLSKFTGMQVKVWGETFKAQKAGWLMDVGRIEVVNPEAKVPATEE